MRSQSFWAIPTPLHTATVGLSAIRSCSLFDVRDMLRLDASITMLVAFETS